MNNDKSERIVNSKVFRWMEGMLALIPGDEGEWFPIRLTAPVAEGWNKKQIKNCLPDIEDPATIGCLLHLLGEQVDIDMIIEVMDNPPGDLVA